MANDRTTKLELPTEKQIVISRVCAAPPALVWKAWSDPKHLSRWWGPQGFTLTNHAFDIRPGGQWRFTFHGPDGRDYKNLITYVAVEEPLRLMYKHGGEADTEPVNFQSTITFEPAGAQETNVTMRMEFPTQAARDFVINTYNAIEGGKQTIGRMDEYVSQLAFSGEGAHDNSVFLITRHFNAPCELVWKAWTNEDHLGKWFGPKEVTIPHCKLDLRTGGMFHYCMRHADGTEHWGRWIFREISEPNRMVFVVSFADEKGNAIKPYFDNDWPLEMLSTVTFAEHAGIGRGTVVSIRWEAINATDIERQHFTDGREGMNAGWSGTLDRLDQFLAMANP